MEKEKSIVTQRRSLVEGLAPGVDPDAAARFVFGDNTDPKPSSPQPERSDVELSKSVGEAVAETVQPALAGSVTTSTKSPRVHITTRLRADLAEALKRASLERQLAGQTPHTVQDIFEAVLTPWLRDHGHL